MNRNGDRPYSDRTLRGLLTRLAARLGIRDDAGVLVDFNRTHRFRHTAATSLLNAGVPIHVVQRYMGHLTPAMTMRYAQTLARQRKRSSCGSASSPPTPARSRPTPGTSTTCSS